MRMKLAHLLHQPEVAAVHFVGQCHADGLGLVAADAAQFVGLPVEEEALSGIEAEVAEGGGVFRAVEHLSAFLVEEQVFHLI